MPTKILPNQLVAHHTPAQAWAYGMSLIERFGDNMRTEDGALCREIMNLHLTTWEPCNPNCWPIQGSGWDMAGLNKYAEQLMNPEKIGFDYTYGNRLRAHECVFDDPDTCVSVMEWDQMGLIIGKLKRQPSSRRCVAVTWYPERDIVADHAPCLQLLDFLIRGGKLHCTAFFRSHDIERAWPCNVYGIAKLMQYIANEVGCETGTLTTISASAHIYCP